MLKDMFLGRIDYAILEVSKEATEKQIELLKKMHPNSVVIKENSNFLKFIYSKLNSNIGINSLNNDIKKNYAFNKSIKEKFSFTESTPYIYNTEKSKESYECGIDNGEAA